MKRIYAIMNTANPPKKRGAVLECRVMIREFNRAGTTGLVVEETSEGYYLYSFPEAGIEGDTWHPTIQEAKEQATYQFGLLDLEWAAVPDDVADLRSFGRQISN